MSWTDYVFGFGPPTPDSPEEILQKKITGNDAESVVRMLQEIHDPCKRADLALGAKGWGKRAEAIVWAEKHLDGTETLNLWRSESPTSGTLVASIDQPECKR